MSDAEKISMLLCALLGCAYVAWRLRRLESEVISLREAIAPKPVVRMPSLTPAIDRHSDVRESPAPLDLPEMPDVPRATALPSHRQRG
jgi:hypothetical protein